MLIRIFKQHPVDFSVLAVIFIFCLVAFLQFSYDPVLKERVVIAAGGLYFLWGIFHHWRKKDLCLSIALEYFLLSVFGVIITVFVLLRA